MAQEIPPEKQRTKVAGKIKGKPVKQESGSLLEILDNSLSKSLPWLIWVFMGITLLFSLLLYDPKVSLSGDDSFYIIRASEFIHSFKYPAFQGPLYPMVLGLTVAIFGISLTPLKLISLAAILSFIYFTYKSLINRIPSTILVITMTLVSINAYLLYYSSQTYSEAFYLFIQSLLIFVFFKKFIDIESAGNLGQDIKRHMLLAACLLALTLTRSIGYSAVIAVAGYFLLRGQWKNLIYFVLAFGGFFLAFQGMKYVFWHESGLQFSTQGSGLLNKDYYNPQDGKEDVAGLLKRYLDNSNLYLSKHFIYMTGFRAYAIILPVLPFVTWIVYLLAIAGLGLTYRKNKYIFFTGLLAGSFLLVTFVVLQAKWDQGRLIIPALPLLILLMASVFYYGSQFKKLRLFQFILPVVAVIAFFQTLATSANHIQEARKETGRFGGLTPDWKHYLQASEWAAANLPKKAVIACRKPSISFVYGKGREFYGIMQMPSYNVEQFFDDWKKNASSMVAFSYNDFAGRQLPPGMFETLKKHMIAQFFAGEKFFFIDRLPDSIRQVTLLEVKALGIRGITSVDSLQSVAKNEKKSSTLIYPDSLLNLLMKNKVSYVLTANLRRNSTVKNGQIINTVERYMAFIDDKYPGIMTKVMQIGSDDNEPASIMKINYGKAGIQFNP